MKAPRRLLDDPAALPVMRTDLQNIAADQFAYDVTRGLAALESTLGEAALSEVASASTGASAAGSAATGASFALKWVLLAAIGGSTLGTAAWLNSSAEPGPAAGAPARPAAVSSSTPAPAPTLQPPQPTLAPEAAPTAERTEPTQVGPSASRREIAQLVRIRALLERDPAAARRAIAAAQREFPAGVLRDEREGLDAIALFRLGETRRARTRAERFIERYPQSPLRPQLELLVAGESP